MNHTLLLLLLLLLSKGIAIGQNPPPPVGVDDPTAVEEQELPLAEEDPPEVDPPEGEEKVDAPEVEPPIDDSPLDDPPVDEDPPTEDPTEAPSSAEAAEAEEVDETRSLADSFAFTTVFSPVGSSITLKASLFHPEDTVVNEKGLLSDMPNPSLAVANYTTTCSLTNGTGDFTSLKVSGASCETSICHTLPEYGGCTFYQSGVEFDFNFSGESVPFSRTGSVTSGTGVERFGVDGFLSELRISGSFLDPDSISVLDINVTTIIGDEFFETIRRNVKLGSNVLGFVSSKYSIFVFFIQ